MNEKQIISHVTNGLFLGNIFSLNPQILNKYQSYPEKIHIFQGINSLLLLNYDKFTLREMIYNWFNNI